MLCSTVDVIYPASPFFVLYGPELLKQALLPVLAYGQNQTDVQYRLPWAPHHLGAWPVADIIGEEQEQMPMEESANLLLMLAGIAQQQKMDVAYLKPYWPALTQWANYLNVSLPDPGEQLCTDDFEGPSPHNVNLGQHTTPHHTMPCHAMPCHTTIQPLIHSHKLTGLLPLHSHLRSLVPSLTPSTSLAVPLLSLCVLVCCVMSVLL